MELPEKYGHGCPLYKGTTTGKNHLDNICHVISYIMRNPRTVGQAIGNDHCTHTIGKGNAAEPGLIRGLKGLQHKGLGGACWTKESCSYF